MHHAINTNLSRNLIQKSSVILIMQLWLKLLLICIFALLTRYSMHMILLYIIYFVCWIFEIKFYWNQNFNFLRINGLGMDIPSSNCIAWFCRSTCPFQTFLVSNIGLLWLGSTKHVCHPSYLGRRTISLPTLGPKQPRSGIEKGENHPVWCHAFACPRIPTTGSG